MKVIIGIVGIGYIGLPMAIEYLKKLYKDNNKSKIIFDIHSIYNKKDLESEGFKVWNL